MNTAHLLPPREAAKYVGSRNRLDELTKSGQLECVRFGAARMWRLGDLLGLQEQNASGPVPRDWHTTAEYRAIVKRAVARIRGEHAEIA